MVKDINTYYYEWLSLSKEEFMILDLLVEEQKFVGNLSDLIRIFNLVPTNRSRAMYRDAINHLESIEYIKVNKSGRTYTLSLKPTEQLISIKVDKTWISLDRLRLGKFSESVHWVQVLKVLLYLIFTHDFIYTNQEIADYLNISTTTVTSAKNVLKNDFNALDIDYQYIEKNSPEDEVRCIGQKAEFNIFTEIPKLNERIQKSLKYKNITYLK